MTAVIDDIHEVGAHSLNTTFQSLIPGSELNLTASRGKLTQLHRAWNSGLNQSRPPRSRSQAGDDFDGWVPYQDVHAQQAQNQPIRRSVSDLAT